MMRDLLAVETPDKGRGQKKKKKTVYVLMDHWWYQIDKIY